MKVLNVGCGLSPIHHTFAGWDEVRLDIDPDVEPDIVCDMLEMPSDLFDDFDAVYSSHTLEHLYAHEVPLALAEFYSVLCSGGLVCIGVPNLEAIAKEIAKGGWALEDILYVSPAGPIAAIDCVYGYRKWVEAGNAYQAHKTGFSPETLKKRLYEAGFYKIEVKTNPDPSSEIASIDMWASGVKE